MKLRLIVALTFFGFVNMCFAQSESPNIGKFPYFRPGQSTILFIDGDIGEIYGFASFGEPISDVTLANEEGLFYAISKNYIYKASVSTGEILDKYLAMEILEQSEGEILNPNDNIIPYGVTPDGIAIYSYNKELFELSKRQGEVLEAMASATGTESAKLAQESADLNVKMAPLYTKQETYKADINMKTTERYKNFDINGNMLIGVDDDGNILNYDKKTNKMVYRNLSTGALVEEYDASGIL